VQVRASDPDVPVNALFFSLEPGAPAGAGIDAGTGLFRWTPSGVQGVQTIVVRVTDNGVPALSRSRELRVVVHPPPTFTEVALEQGGGPRIALSWSAVAGTRYRVEFKDDLDEAAWTPLGAEVAASGPVATIEDGLEGIAQRFYRIVVLP